MQDAIVLHGSCILGLSGGGTPRGIYEQLGANPLLDWSKVSLFLVDDRFIRGDDPDSNQFLIRSTILRQAPIPESQIYVPDTSLPISECVAKYNEELHALFARRPPDIVTLGLGSDGHTASLFPPVINAAFGDNVAIHTTTDAFAVHDRISLTLPAIESAQWKVWLIKGPDKKAVWESMMASPENARRWPGKAVIESGNNTVFGWW